MGILNKICNTIGAGCYLFAASFGVGGLYVIARGDLGAGLLVLLSAPVAVMMAEGMLYSGDR